MILDYYLDTDRYFHSCLHLFFDLFEHTGDCIGHDGIIRKFETAVAVQTFQREHEDAGFFFQEKPQWLYQYFSTEYTQEQVFSVVFGAWYGLSPKMCHLIGNRNWRKLSWRILNAFLCKMTYDEVNAVLRDKSKTVLQKKAALEQVAYTGAYTIFLESGQTLAIREQDSLITPEGMKFRVAYEKA